MWQTILAIAVGGSILSWYFADGIIERRRRKRHQDYFVPLIGARLKVTGGRFWHYEAWGDYRDREVCIECAPMTGRRMGLHVTTLRARLNRFKHSGWTGADCECEGASYHLTGDQLVQFAGISPHLEEQANLLEATRAALDRLCAAADWVDAGHAPVQDLVRK